MTTKIPVELSSTPSIVDNGDATAITIDSSENVGIGISSIAREPLQVLDSGGNRGQRMSCNCFRVADWRAPKCSRVAGLRGDAASTGDSAARWLDEHSGQGEEAVSLTTNRSVNQGSTTTWMRRCC